MSLIAWRQVTLVVVSTQQALLHKPFGVHAGGDLAHLTSFPPQPSARASLMEGKLSAGSTAAALPRRGPEPTRR
jgi:hypothetical protein